MCAGIRKKLKTAEENKKRRHNDRDSEEEEMSPEIILKKIKTLHDQLEKVLANKNSARATKISHLDSESEKKNRNRVETTERNHNRIENNDMGETESEEENSGQRGESRRDFEMNKKQSRGSNFRRERSRTNSEERDQTKNISHEKNNDKIQENSREICGKYILGQKEIIRTTSREKQFNSSQGQVDYDERSLDKNFEGVIVEQNERNRKEQYSEKDRTPEVQHCSSAGVEEQQGRSLTPESMLVRGIEGAHEEESRNGREPTAEKRKESAREEDRESKRDRKSTGSKENRECSLKEDLKVTYRLDKEKSGDEKGNRREDKRDGGDYSRSTRTERTYKTQRGIAHQRYEREREERELKEREKKQRQEEKEVRDLKRKFDSHKKARNR